MELHLQSPPLWAKTKTKSEGEFFPGNLVVWSGGEYGKSGNGFVLV
ncbi:MAG: hypothetical protein WBF90_33535 [Rivularia sp. (in: cyanobacteria)]|jgi:hypothetical protein